MQVTVRVTTSNSKWTTIQYLSSHAKSRVPTKSILDQIEKGKMIALNPSNIHGYQAPIHE